MITGRVPVAKKSLGQHWLIDETCLHAIRDMADIKPGEVVLEIGPGTGNLTRLLLEKAAKVIAVEVDIDLFNSLNKLELPKLEVINQDILKLDFRSLPKGYKIVANIPYYLTGKLIRLISEADNRPSLVVLLVQKEIAERISAKPGQLSILALTSQYFFDIEKGLLIGPDKFDPSPKVDSQVICMKPKVKLPLSLDQQVRLFKLIRAGFVSRRKTILNNLSSSYHLDKTELQHRLTDFNIEPSRRPQSLTLEEWIRISGYLQALEQSFKEIDDRVPEAT